MNRYWLNQSGCHDPTMAKVIESENAMENRARNKQVHDTIREIKNILDSRDLQLIGRIMIKDKTTKREYK